MNSLLLKVIILIGEIVLICAFFLFRGDMPTNIFVLYMIVSSIIYLSFFIDFFISWVRPEDKSHRIFGGLGVRWYSVGLYAFLAISAMLFASFEYELSFETQLCIHSGLLLLFLFALGTASRSSEKVAQVYEEQRKDEESVIRMQKQAALLLQKAQTIGVPTVLTDRIRAFKNDTRYLSPTNNPEAKDLDDRIIGHIEAINVEIQNVELNGKDIEKGLSMIESLYAMRKSTYSI